VSQQVVDLISALAWPAVVLVVLLVYRRTLPRLITGVLGRATRLSVFQIAIDLAPAPDAYTRGFVADVVESGLAIYQESGISGVLQEIAKEGQSDYAVIELGSGNRWLTSRLFLFAAVLKRMRGLLASCSSLIATSLPLPHRMPFAGRLPDDSLGSRIPTPPHIASYRAGRSDPPLARSSLTTYNT
jgi:hypothetical protein